MVTPPLKNPGYAPVRGECLRQQNSCKAVLRTVYIPFEDLSFPDSGKQIAVKNKTAIKFKRYRLFRMIVMHAFNYLSKITCLL